VEVPVKQCADVIRWAVAVVSGRLPGLGNCLVQTLAAQRMLQNRHVPGVLYLGVASDDKASRQRAIHGHAWLKCGDEFITGKFTAETYTAVTAFVWR
jgi:hypothetical protein